MAHIIYFDGSCLNNGASDAVAACAWVDDTTGLSFSDSCNHPDRNTNNRAEYEGLRRAMWLAKDMGYKEPLFRGDSRLVIEQMKGNWKAKDSVLRSIRDSLISYAQEHFDSVTYEWVSRDYNPADRAAGDRAGRSY